MKITYSLFILSLLTLAGCSTTHPQKNAKDGPETVIVRYHVQSGKEAEFQTLLAHAWDVYRDEHLVYAKPHVIVRETEEAGNPCFVEIFTWVKAPDHAPESVMKVWREEQSSCEARNGRKGIEGGPVELVTK